MEVRKRNMKIDSVKYSIGSFSIYECIMSKVWKNNNNKTFYFTIRHLPTSEVKETRSEISEEILICLHVEGKIFHFHLIITLK